MNHADVNGQTAIFYAASYGRNETIEYLIGAYANVNHPDKKRKTALWHARKENHPDTVKLLLDNGAINTKDGRVSKSQSRVKKAPKKKKKKIITKFHKVQYTDGQGNTRILTQSEFTTILKAQHPQLAAYFENPELLLEKTEVLAEVQSW